MAYDPATASQAILVSPEARLRAIQAQLDAARRQGATAVLTNISSENYPFNVVWLDPEPTGTWCLRVNLQPGPWQEPADTTLRTLGADPDNPAALEVPSLALSAAQLAEMVDAILQIADGGDVANVGYQLEPDLE